MVAILKSLKKESMILKYLIKNKGTLACLSLLIMLAACKKDELSSKELLVYLLGDKASLTNSTKLNLIHTPTEINGEKTAEFYVNATREVPANVNLEVEADVSVVDAFNAKHGTRYLPAPTASYRIVSDGPYVIPAGSAKSSSAIKVELTNTALLNGQSGYLLPIALKSLSSEDRGVQISSSHKHVYIEIVNSFENIAEGQAPVTGTLMSRAGWIATASNITNGAPAINVLDGSNSTVWRSSNSATAAKWIVLNMGVEQTIKNFIITPNHNNTSENATSILLATSSDNVNWVEQGRWTGTGPASGTNAASPDLKGINLRNAITAQYFRFTITSQTSGNRVGMAEINAVQ